MVPCHVCQSHHSWMVDMLLVRCYSMAGTTNFVRISITLMFTGSENGGCFFTDIPLTDIICTLSYSWCCWLFLMHDKYWCGSEIATCLHCWWYCVTDSVTRQGSQARNRFGAIITTLPFGDLHGRIGSPSAPANESATYTRYSVNTTLIDYSWNTYEGC